MFDGLKMELKYVLSLLVVVIFIIMLMFMDLVFRSIGWKLWGKARRVQGSCWERLELERRAREKCEGP